MRKTEQRILVVDDNQSMRKMLESMLVNLGYNTIQSATDGEKGWQKIREEEIDIVISDYVMPGMNGLDFLHRIRRSQEYFNLPFIMITGADNWSDFIGTVQAEVDNYLIKPISLVRLEEVLNQVHLQQRSSHPYLEAIHTGKHSYMNNDLNKAFKNFLMAQAMEPNLAKPYFYLGMISRKMGRDSDAEKFFVKCLEIETNYINAIIGLIDIYSTRDDSKQMLFYLDKALQIAPTNIDLHIKKAGALFKTGDLHGTRTALKAATRLAKSNREHLEKIIEAYINSDMLDEADFLFGKKMQEDDGETVRFWNRLGLTAKGKGDREKSKFFYLSALKLSPQAKEVNFNLAILLFEEGEYMNAMAYTNKILRLYPDFSEAQKLQRCLQRRIIDLSG